MAPISIAQYPRDARRELREMLAVAKPPYSKRKQARNLILTAQSYLLEGEYEEAVKNVREGLVLAHEIGSTINVADVASLYEALEAANYGKNNVEMALLDIELTKIRYLDFFS